MNKKVGISYNSYCKNVRNGVAIGSIEDNVFCAKPAVRLERDIWMVVLFRQVGEASPLEPLCLGSTAQNICGLDIREMAPRPFDALLEIGGIGSGCEHVRVVIALKENRVDGRDEMNKILEHVAEVGHDTEPFRTRTHDESRAIRAVMRRGDRLYQHIAESEVVARPEVTHVLKLAESAPRRCCSERSRSDIDWEAVLSLKHAGVPNVITVIVGDYHCIDLSDVPPVGNEPLSSLHAGDAGVEQELHTTCFHVNAVTVAA